MDLTGGQLEEVEDRIAVPNVFLTCREYLAGTLYDNLIITALIFYPRVYDLATMRQPLQPSRVLLVQYKNTHPAYPGLWVVPGGPVVPADRTLRHALARLVSRDTYLHYARSRAQVNRGGVIIAERSRKVWLSFIVEVKELASSRALLNGSIRLSTAYQRFVWATEEAVATDCYPFMWPPLKNTLLEAFSVRGELVQSQRSRADPPYACCGAMTLDWFKFW